MKKGVELQECRDTGEAMCTCELGVFHLMLGKGLEKVHTPKKPCIVHVQKRSGIAFGNVHCMVLTFDCQHVSSLRHRDKNMQDSHAEV